jgi:fumarate hydratase subunit beta
LKTLNISTPLDDRTIEQLSSGDQVYITGTIYTARDAAHKRMIEALRSHQPLPFDVSGQVIYYAGPTPARPGNVIGSVGPTTSSRMDSYTPELLAAGLKGMIGKGNRSKEVRDAVVRYRAVYFAAIGGAGALIAPAIKKAEVIAYADLGAEAIYRLTVEDFPAIVINDACGGDLYEEGRAGFRLSGD